MAEWYEKKTLGTLLDEAAARWSAREALTYEGQRWSFAHLQAEVDRTARAFLQPGDSPWRPGGPLDAQPARVAVYVLRPGQNWRRGGAHQHALPYQ